MFGISKTKLEVSLERIRTALCAYIGSTCDCKYIHETIKNEDICMRHEAGSGCPEIMEAIALVKAMTPAEFKRIAKRAKIVVEV